MFRKIFFAIIFLITIFVLPSFAAEGRAVIQGTKKGTKRSKPIQGVVMIHETKGGLEITAHVSGVKRPGKHGFHIHEFGGCSNEGKSAGGHYNPKKAKHGYFPKDGRRRAHLGDLGNINIDREGRGHLKVFVKDLSLSGGKYPIAGRAFILHEDMDDFGQPTGNAGARIACGTIIITAK